MERAISRAVTFGPNAKSNRMDGAMAREQASCYGVNLAVGVGSAGGGPPPKMEQDASRHYFRTEGTSRIAWTGRWRESRLLAVG
jgi:hypothetical protein